MQAFAHRTVAAPHRSPSQGTAHWLKRYYAMRALASVVWTALALTVGRAQPPQPVQVDQPHQNSGAFDVQVNGIVGAP